MVKTGDNFNLNSGLTKNLPTPEKPIHGKLANALRIVYLDKKSGGKLRNWFACTQINKPNKKGQHILKTGEQDEINLQPVILMNYFLPQNLK